MTKATRSTKPSGVSPDTLIFVVVAETFNSPQAHNDPYARVCPYSIRLELMISTLANGKNRGSEHEHWEH